MRLTLQDLKNAASSLPVSERAELAECHQRSLDEQKEEGARAEWLTLPLKPRLPWRASRRWSE